MIEFNLLQIVLGFQAAEGELLAIQTDQNFWKRIWFTGLQL